MDENVITDNVQCQDVNLSDHSCSFIGDSATSDSSLPSPCVESCDEDNLDTETGQGLFSDSTISVQTSTLLICSFFLSPSLDVPS